MRTFAGRSAASGLALGFALACLATTASAQSFTVEEPSSVLIFPKVVCEDDPVETDTVIQTTNTSNMMAYAHCFYTDGQSVNGLPRWTVTDFQISLTRQQTSTWSACTGRPVNPADDQGGLDPGAVPPVVPGFTGSLVCVQMDSPFDGAPSGANDLTGRADVGGAGYNAIGVPALGTPGDDNVLSLDGVEYAQCPSAYHLNFATNGSQGALALGPMMNMGLNDSVASVSTAITVVPCSFDFAGLRPADVALNFPDIWDEMETRGSQGVDDPVICWENIQLDGTGFELPTAFGTAIVEGSEIQDQAGPRVPAPFVAVASVLRVGGTSLAVDSATTNLHAVDGELADGQIILP